MGSVISDVCCPNSQQGTNQQMKTAPTITPQLHQSREEQKKDIPSAKYVEIADVHKTVLPPTPQPPQPPQTPQAPRNEIKPEPAGPPPQITKPQPPAAERKRVTIDDFDLLKTIGRGSFGKVYLAKHKATGQLLALKKLKKKEIEERVQADNVLTEKKILQIASNPFIVKLTYAFQNDSSIYLGMEYMPGGELFYHLRNMKRFNESTALFYAAEVLLALEYLHDSLNVIYRDLKPENILLDKDGHIKLTDFGLSKMDKVTNSFCGTPEYFAPEIIIGGGYGFAVDWWSFGCFLFELLVGRPPFQDQNRSKLYKMIIEGKVTYPDKISVDARDLINRLLNTNAEERLGARSAKDVKEHKFFSKVNWTAVAEKKVTPPFKPQIRSEQDVSNFDELYTTEQVRETPAVPVKQMQYENFTYVPPNDLLRGGNEN
eukprot:TRINITY_DN1030_c0_g1_i2.p1 TRINITY_DN1030_c0_g1~~TRINITY_DN1030_c0_g1_i2.p1  ORF type:complete len:430 (+),score=93.11 TRINITY_DN1030_c0_g1_i2:63-1352(+)